MRVNHFAMMGFAELLVIGFVLAAVVGGVILLVVLVTRQRGLRRPAMQPAERKQLLDERETRFRAERGRLLDMVQAGQITAEEADRLIDTMHRQTATMSCPFCAEEIQVQAVKCRYCHSTLVDTRAGRRLAKSRDRVLAGVCGGLAEYLDADPTLVRVGTVVVVLFTAVLPAIVVYVLAAIIMPEPI